MNVIFNILSAAITIRTPIAVGIYFISSGLFSLAEEIGYRIYRRLNGELYII